MDSPRKKVYAVLKIQKHATIKIIKTLKIVKIIINFKIKNFMW